MQPAKRKSQLSIEKEREHEGERGRVQEVALSQTEQRKRLGLCLHRIYTYEIANVRVGPNMH